jgi:hypothetical protein
MNLDELAQKYGGSPVQSGSSKFDELARKYGGTAAEAEVATQRKSTIGSELVRGGKQLASSIRTGVGALTGSPEEAAVAGVARGQAIGKEAGEGASLEAVKKAYQDKGLLSAAGEVAGQIPRALAGQVPQLAAMAASAKLGAMAGTAVAPGPGTVIGGVLGAGASLLPQFFGSNVERQAAEQMAKDQAVQIDRGAAGAAAAGQAAIESAGTAFVLGKRIVKGVLGVADDAALATANAQKAMTKAAERSLAAAAGRGVAKGAVTEIPVEIAQSVLERAQAGLDVTSPEALSEYGEVAYQAGLVGGAIGAGAGPVDTAMARQGVKARAAFEEAEAKRIAEEEKARTATKAPPAAEPSPTQAIEDQAAELERQQKRQQAAMERARAGGIGGGSEVNQTLLEQARIRKEQQERAAAAEEKAAEAERQRALRAERVRIGSTQYSGDPMMNEVLRSRAIAEFDAANAPKAPEIPAFQPTKTIEDTTPITQPEGFNVLRGLDARNTDLMSAVSERRAAEEAAAATKAKAVETKKAEETAKVDATRADVDQRFAQIENFLMSPAKKTQQETADYMAGVVPEMQKDFLALLDEDMNQPLTPEQAEALKTQIRQRLQPEAAPEEAVQRTPFKKFLAAKGMNKQDVQDIFGENAYRANQQLPGAIRADAPRLDMLAEAAVEAGFLQEEDTEALVEMIKAEFGGNEQVSVDMAGDRAAAEYEARRESELEDRAAAIGLKTKGMTPDQIAARLDRIERKREEKRKQYSRSVDGFADLPTAEQDRIIDMMIDQFGEPQIFDVERAEIEGRVREEEELLQTQNEQQLRNKQAEIDRLNKENERLSKEAERKAKADEEAGDFVLTGSDRVADKAAARGQTDIFSEEGAKPGEAVDENDTGFIGASDEEVADVAEAFDLAAKRQDYDKVTRVFDAPEKSEIVRVESKTKVFVKDSGYMTVEEAKQRIAEWKKNAQSQSGSRANSEKVVLSLFDTTGEWSKPWEEAGYQVYRFDIQDDPEFGDVNKFSSEFFNDLFGAFEGQDVYAVLAACPCTDFASSGARHFAAKDADGRTVESVNLVKQTLATIEYFKPSVWAIENPVGRIEKLTGLPPWRLSFNPNHFGDPYTKKTLLWGRFNADLPIAPVEPVEGSKMHRLYGGKSQATKNARSVTPEGFAYAFFQANNAIDNPVMAVANKYDMLDRSAVEAAVDAKMTDQQIADVVDDPYYMDLDYDAASAALQEAADGNQEPMFAAETATGYNISAEDQRTEEELTGKSMIQAADWAVANAPNAFAKLIAEKVRNRLREFQRKGMTLEFNISGGSTRPRMLSGARGVTQFEWGKGDKGTKITVTLNGAAVMNNQGGYPPGVQYNTILHELLHVATRSQFVFMPNTDPLRKQMTELFNLVADRFNADAKAGTLPPVMERYYKRMNNVLTDPDELLAWGLTDKEVQAYLDDIKVGDKSVFTRLVELIRTALGLGKPYESALERLVRTSESMLDVDVDAIDAMLGSKDKQIGVKKKPSGPMVQESLFQKEGAERRPYASAPKALMGFRKSGPNKSYEESTYKKEITVRVTFDNGQSFVDGMKGLNTPHALERARRNWDGATIELLAEEPYSDELAAKFGEESVSIATSKPAAMREVGAPDFREDIPNESWLQGKIEYAQSSPRNEFGVPKMSSVTGRFTEPVMVPSRWLKDAKGQRGEEKNVRQKDLDAIRKIIRETGKFPLNEGGTEYVPYIEIGYDGKPWVSEGNHRIMAAIAEGMDYIPVELRYFDGGQRRAGVWGPGNIASITERVKQERPAAMRGEAPKTGPGTAAFDRWFGDSSVVDENGEPKIFYHDGSSKFTGIQSGKGRFGGALFVKEGSASGYGDASYALFVRGPILELDEMAELLGNEGGREILEKATRQKLDDDQAEQLTDALTNGEDYPTDSDVWDLIGAIDEADAQKEIQMLRGRVAKGLGFGAVRTPDEFGGQTVMITDPSQVKSATDNIGTFDPENADIRYQREAEPEAGQPKPSRQNIFGQPVLGTWSITVDPKMEVQDGLIYKMLDKNIDVKRIVEAVKSTGKQIASQWNPYLQEELYHGRTANASQEFQDKEWLPLLKDMDKKGVTVGELEKYLLNRHAEDYNKLVAKRNPNRPEMQDGGSSVKTADARKYLADLDKDTKAKYEELAKRIDGITKGTRQLLVDNGYEKEKTIKNWEDAFPNYVPLMREEADFDYNFSSFGTGRGFDVRRDFSRSAMGSKRNVVDIIGNVISARNQAIALTEKNRVAQAVYGLALEAPNPDFWMAINPDLAEVREVERIKQKIAKYMERKSDPSITDDELDGVRSSLDSEYRRLKLAKTKATEAIERVKRELIDLGIPAETISAVMQEPEQRILDVKKGEVVSRINTKLRENDHVLATRINGEKRYVFFNPNDPRSKRAATALKNLDAQDLGTAMGMIAKATRWMASVNTQYNPIFGPYNFLRDVQSAALQLSTTELAGQQKQVAENIVPALRAIYSSLRKRRKGDDAKGEMADLWKEFQKEGGQTGFKDNFSRTQDRTEALLNEMEKITEGKFKANARAVFDWLSDYNDSLENAVRLSAYKVAKKKFADEGFSDSEAKQKAASLAKNLTVNFNRKGDVATQMGALYAFFNASMQGTARMIETLKGPAGKRIMAGGLLLGSMQAALLAAAGFDDEEPPEFIRSKNIVIPTGGGNYVAFPMPLGFHVIPGVSRIMSEWALSGFKDTSRRVTDLTGLFLDAFNPIGNAGWSVQTITPTVLDPFVALGENKDWTGKPISKEDIFSLRPTPGYTRARDGANWLAIEFSKFLNYASGGTKYQPGVLSPTPEQIEYLVGQAFGGVGREAIKLATSIEKTATGEDLPPYKIPLYGRFVGETKSSAAESNRFYKNMERLNRLDLEIKGRRENREPLGDFMKENREARLLPMANNTYKNIQALRKRRATLVERNAPKESVQAVEKLITRKMQMLNDRVRSLEESN